MEQWKLCTPFVGVLLVHTAALESSLALSGQVHMHISSNPAFLFRVSHLETLIHASGDAINVDCSSPMSIKRRMDRWSLVYSHSRVHYGSENACTTALLNNMGEYQTKCRSKTNVLSENSDSPFPFLQSSKTCETRQYIVQDCIHLWENCKEKDKEMINTKFRLLPPDGRDMQSSRRDMEKLQELIMSALLSRMVGIWLYYYYYFTYMFYMDEMFLI